MGSRGEDIASVAGWKHKRRQNRFTRRFEVITSQNKAAIAMKYTNIIWQSIRIEDVSVLQNTSPFQSGPLRNKKKVKLFTAVKPLETKAFFISRVKVIT